jgi:hypothetical protein
VHSLLNMGEYRPKHVEALTPNKQTTKSLSIWCWILNNSYLYFLLTPSISRTPKVFQTPDYMKKVRRIKYASDSSPPSNLRSQNPLPASYCWSLISFSLPVLSSSPRYVRTYVRTTFKQIREQKSSSGFACVKKRMSRCKFIQSNLFPFLARKRSVRLTVHTADTHWRSLSHALMRFCVHTTIQVRRAKRAPEGSRNTNSKGWKKNKIENKYGEART